MALDNRITKHVTTGEGPRILAARNRRTALALVAWIALLALVSMAVAWFRN